jgi:DNA-binding XRE family transcriptional regulator
MVADWNAKAFGHRVRHARTQAQLSQADLAMHLDHAGRAGVANIEAGRQNVYVSAVVVIARVTGADRGWLLTGNEDVPDIDGTRLRAIVHALSKLTADLSDKAGVGRELVAKLAAELNGDSAPAPTTTHHDGAREQRT